MADNRHTIYPRLEGELILRTTDGQEITLGKATFSSSIDVELNLPPHTTLDWERA